MTIMCWAIMVFGRQPFFRHHYSLLYSQFPQPAAFPGLSCPRIFRQSQNPYKRSDRKGQKANHHATKCQLKRCPQLLLRRCRLHYPPETDLWKKSCIERNLTNYSFELELPLLKSWPKWNGRGFTWMCPYFTSLKVNLSVKEIHGLTKRFSIWQGRIQFEFPQAAQPDSL